MPTTELFELSITWDENVYEPYEDTVLLVEGVDAAPGMACLDVCTGTGLAALVMAREAGAAVATDVSPHACRLARENALANELWLDVICMDVTEGLDAPFDRIACNPPYLPTGPDDTFPGPVNRAVSGGEDGAEISRRLIDEVAELLAPGGRAWLIVSSLQPVAELHERANDRGLTWTVEEEEALGGFEHLARVRMEHAEAMEEDARAEGGTGAEA